MSYTGSIPSTTAMSRIAPPLGLPSPAEEGAGATAVEAEAREDPSRCGGMGESTDGVIAEDGDFTSESTSSEGAGALLVDAAAIVAGAESSCCSVGADDGSTHDPQGAAFGLESWSQQPRPLANHFWVSSPAGRQVGSNQVRGTTLHKYGARGGGNGVLARVQCEARRRPSEAGAWSGTTCRR